MVSEHNPCQADLAESLSGSVAQNVIVEITALPVLSSSVPLAGIPTGIPTAASNGTSGKLGCGPIILDFHSLAHGRSEIFISLDGEAYRLRLTRNHKLILTK